LAGNCVPRRTGNQSDDYQQNNCF